MNGGDNDSVGDQKTHSFVSDSNCSAGEDNDDSSSETEPNQTKSNFSIFENPQKCGLLKVNNNQFSVECDVRKEHKKIRCPKLKKKSKNHKEKIGGGGGGSSAISNKTPRAPDVVSICTIHSRYEVITRVAREMQWKLVAENELCNIYWTDAVLGVEFCRCMRRFQKMNHFPGMFEICRKDLLARNLNRMLKQFPDDYSIFPKTWHLPADFGDAAKFMKSHRNRTYILKPDQGAQGRGISLIRSLKDVSPTDHMICQLYISRPLLIDGFKFDLRVYALITSVDPLRLYVYNEGLARFATSPYKEPKGHNTTNMYMHLTNYSVNKHSRTYSKDEESGSKRKFSTLNRILSSHGYDVVTLWNNIDDVVVKTVISAWPVLRHNYRASFPSHDITQACFEILGVDIIIDQYLKPWLLEVNHSPSFHMDSAVDREVKLPLIRDTFKMLNIKASDKRNVLEADKRRVSNRLMRQLKMWRNSSLTPSNVSEKTSMSNLSAAEGDRCDESSAPPAPTKVTMGRWREQVEWEETHMGGFRRVVPVPGNSVKYTDFFTHANQASVFYDTAASKRREEAATRLRTIIAEKEKFPIPLKGDQIVPIDWKSMKKKRLRAVSSGFHMEPIHESEERERLALMAQRDFIIKSCDVVQCIYVGFYRNNLLSGSDLKKYEELNKHVDSQFEILHHERKLRIKCIKDGKVSTYI